MNNAHRHKVYVEGRIELFIHSHAWNRRFTHNHKVSEQLAYWMDMPRTKKAKRLQVAK